MKRNTNLTFFDISSDIESLPKSELFRLTGGDSDIAWEDELDPIDIDPPGDDPWDGGGDDDPDPWEWDDRWDDDEGDGGGNEGGNPGGNSGGNGGDNEGNNPSQDPFPRDENGNILVNEIEGKTFSKGFGQYLIHFQEYKIEGTDIIVYKPYKAEVWDSTGENRIELSSIPDDFKANCYGFAFGEGEFWFLNPSNPDLRDPSFNEMAGFEELLDTHYESGVNKEEADAVIIWADFGDGWDVWHAAQIDSDGNFVHTTDHLGVQIDEHYGNFFNDSIGENDPNSFQTVYYKKK